ncbi:Rab family GTPase [Beggiatoa leptomitoformis]|uniref:GTP-binding protein n=1 Tax=Beggiatoa leptomitoformis TaxID=288004 RepID=A0A2N9YD85_9GAMM|nr:Rab family GTPase [Beggiatoa leptomitoformis]ALG69122.1 GTP-binding protein [Beggiatoa leptomitoformis]AUI68463.1 GTP-binding protein [Beggiatoa leptomitoformis]
MLQKKICMIGDFSVGKTSLVARYVHQAFSDKYLTTVGVKIDTKLVTLPTGDMKFILWDIAGADKLTTASMTYLRGAAGYLLVVDGTRLPTWESAINLQQAVTQQIGNKPFLVLLNKCDLQNQWEVNETRLAPQREQGWHFLETSAKEGLNVENAFLQLAQQLVG